MVKLARFFKALSRSLAERIVLSQSLEADSKYRRKVGEHILELLDRIDSEREPHHVRSCVCAFARGGDRPYTFATSAFRYRARSTYEIESVRVLGRGGSLERFGHRSIGKQRPRSQMRGSLTQNSASNGNMLVLN